MKEISKPTLLLPLMGEKVIAGFPSSIYGNKEAKLDLNEYVVKNPAATFFVKVSGDSMKNAGIFSGDLLVVDKSLKPVNDSIVIAEVNGELTVKKLRITNKKVYLLSENNKYKPILVNSEEGLSIWGVVTFVVHSLV